MNNSNNKLTGEYKTAYQDIISYLQACNISQDSKFSADVQEDMKDMLLSAQINQLPVNNIIGNDIKSFCEDIVQAHNTKKVKLLRLLKDLIFSLAFLAVISALFQIFNVNYNLTIAAAFLITWLLYRYIMNYLYKKLCLKFKGLKNKIKCLLLIFLICIITLIPVVLIISRYCDLMINGYYTAIICILLILPADFACRKLDKNFKWYSYMK